MGRKSRLKKQRREERIEAGSFGKTPGSGLKKLSTALLKKLDEPVKTPAYSDQWTLTKPVQPKEKRKLKLFHLIAIIAILLCAAILLFVF